MIAITSSGENLNSRVNPRFGRSQHFLLADEDGLEKVISNPGVGARRGAGIQAAQTIVGEGVEVLITGSIGPNAWSALSTAGVKIFLSAAIPAKDAFEKWQNDELEQVEAPTGRPGPRGFGRRRGRDRGAG